MKLDINGVLQLQNELKKLESQLVVAKLEKGEVAGRTIGDDFDYEQATLKVTALQQDILTKRKQLANVELVKSHGKKDCIDIGDVVKVYDKTFDDSFDVLLTGNFNVNLKSDDSVEDVSINSPLGEAIYGKKNGDTVSYEVRGVEHQVDIINVSKNFEKELTR